MHLIYSQTRHPLADGRRLINPRFFDGPVDGAQSVVILGDWPKIAEAYRALGVEVVEPELSERAPGVVLAEAPAEWVDPVKPSKRRRRKADPEPNGDSPGEVAYPQAFE